MKVFPLFFVDDSIKRDSDEKAEKKERTNADFSPILKTSP